MAEDLGMVFKNAFYLVIGGVTAVVEETGKNLQSLANQAQTLADEMITKGEAQYHQWYQHSDSALQPKEELRQRLFILVKGDWGLAERLLAQVKFDYPNRLEDWYWEKVIYDLERDRH
jgi:hypothetical protein